jgi:Ca2+-binding RTX toxin-like protein
MSFIRKGRRGRRTALVATGALFAFQALALVGAQTASAAVTSCSFASGTLTVNISGATTISIDPASTDIWLDGTTSDAVPCSAIPAVRATTANTTEIDVNGSAVADTLTIPLTSRWGTINWKIDLGAGTDSLVLDGTALTAAMDGPIVGATGIDFNDDGDLDATVAGVEGITINCGSGDDFVTGVGSTITGGPTSIPMTINGNAGYDDIGGGLGNDTLTVDGDGGAVDYLGLTGPIVADLSAGTITGAGSDTTDATDITGSDGNDTITANAVGSDMAGGPGDDTLKGAAGEDTADFWDSEAGVTVDLAAGTATGDGNDTLTNIEDVYGSSFNDNITGQDKVDNYLDAQAGVDWVNYSADFTDLTVDLRADTDPVTPGNQPACSGDLNTECDTLLHFENAKLGSGDDTFTGNAFNNVVRPGGGQNSLDGQGGGDTINYKGYEAGVTVNLAGGGTSGDSATSFENVTGTKFKDNVTGGVESNTIKTLAGNDNVKGGSGDDTLRLGKGNDLGRGGSGDDDLYGQGGNDTLSGGGGSDFCKGGKGKDTVKGCEFGHK